MASQNLLQSIFGANFGGQPQLGQPQMSQIFRRKYHAYPPSNWNNENRHQLENGDKIVMPASALEELSRMQIQFPMMFEIAHNSDISTKRSHCSVLEFTAPEGTVYIPSWMMSNLGLDPYGNSVVELTNVSLPKGTSVQFKAHDPKFASSNNNPTAALAKGLRLYSCLTVGDTIQVQFTSTSGDALILLFILAPKQ